MKRLLAALFSVLIAGAACGQAVNTPSQPPIDTGSLMTRSLTTLLVAQLAAGNGHTYGAATTTNSGNTYASAAGSTPCVSQYVIGQIFVVPFNAVNTGAATWNLCGLGDLSIKVQTGSNGALSSLTGGELRGTRLLVYDGSELILDITPSPRIIPVTGSVTITAANWVFEDTYVCTSTCTFTLPAISSLSAGGYTRILSAGVTSTINTAGGTDYIAKNGTGGSSTSTTITQSGLIVLANGEFLASGT